MNVNDLRKTVFGLPMASDDMVQGLSNQMDTLLETSVREMWATTDFPVRHLAQYINRILHLSLRNQKVLQSIETKSGRSDRFNAATPPDQVYSADEIQCLSAAIMAANRKAYGLPVDLSLRDDFKLFVRTRVEVVRAFRQETRTYVSCMVRLAREAATIDRQSFIGLSNELSAVGQAVGADSDIFYTVIVVDRLMQKRADVSRELCSPFLRKVWSVVASRTSQQDPRFVELFQCAVSGLIAAADCYEASRKNSFGAFAGHWIDQQLLHHMKSWMNLITQNSKDIQRRTTVRTHIRSMGLSGMSLHDQVTALAASTGMKRSEVVHSMIDDIALSGYADIDGTFGKSDSTNSLSDILPDTRAIESDIEAEAEDVIQRAYTITEGRVRVYLTAIGMESSIPSEPLTIDTLIRQSLACRRLSVSQQVDDPQQW